MIDKIIMLLIALDILLVALNLFKSQGAKKALKAAYLLRASPYTYIIYDFLLIVNPLTSLLYTSLANSIVHFTKQYSIVLFGRVSLSQCCSACLCLRKVNSSNTGSHSFCARIKRQRSQLQRKAQRFRCQLFDSRFARASARLQKKSLSIATNIK